jgi:hypothetical protein
MQSSFGSSAFKNETKMAYLLKIYYHSSFQAPVLNGDIVIHTSNVRASVNLLDLLSIVGN